jgi:DNA (cytosine-5)-methyltransferase 1
MAAYYNEHDAFAAAWLRNLMQAGLIPEGDVDERSILNVRADDLRAYRQCHFFAGIGGWSHALRLAGWADDREIWTGSCPCQPFSVAGKGKGKSDERHLWPVFFELIRNVRPSVVMGEQVAGKAGYGWFDGVRSDLEGEDYSARAVDIPACAVNAPHIRQRLYWVAYAESIGWRQGAKNIGGLRSGDSEEGPVRRLAIDSNVFSSAVGNADSAERPPRNVFGSGTETRPERAAQPSLQRSAVGDADALRELQPQGAISQQRGWAGDASGEHSGDVGNSYNRNGYTQPGIQEGQEPQCSRSNTRDASGFWHEHEWLTGADGKTRRAKPGVRLLVDGISNRVGRLRGYGNAIVPPLAAEVIKAFMEVAP